MTSPVTVPNTIPASCREAFARFLHAAEATDPAVLEKDLDTYMAFLRQEGKWRAHLQQGFIEKMDLVGHALLREYQFLPREHQMLVSAALLYFIEPADSNHAGL
jgi:hypothetical protein